MGPAGAGIQQPVAGDQQPQGQPYQPPVDPQAAPDNVVYLHTQPGEEPLPAHPHVDAYQHAIQEQQGPGAVQPASAGEGMPVPHAQPPGQIVPGRASTQLPGHDEPSGGFWDDTPSAMIFDEDREPRVIGTLVALSAVALMVAACAVYAAELSKGAGGASAGGFVLLSALVWVWYLSLPAEQQHKWLLRRHRKVSSFLDRRVDPLRNRTATRMRLRRDRERYRSMRDERTRRVNELGELAYRQFRAGGADAVLTPNAKRVMAIEQQMMLQDHRIHETAAEGSSAEAAPPLPE